MSASPLSPDDATIRDRLALTRTQLANERTLLAYLRTAIMLAVTGATFLKFAPDDRVAVISGWALIPIAVVVGLIGVRRFRNLATTLQ